MKALSSLSSAGAVAADGYAIKLGVSSLSTSAAQSSAQTLNIGAVSSLSSSVTMLSDEDMVFIPAVAISAIATLSAAGVVTRHASASLSASGTTLNVGVVHMVSASLLADTVTLSGGIVGTFTPSKELSASASISNAPSLTINEARGVVGSVSVSSNGMVEKLGQAHLSTLGPFSAGFTQGFSRGCTLTGNGTITQEILSAKASMHGLGTVERLASASLSSNVTFISEVCRFLSTASLAGNSVLLLGGSANLNASTVLTPILSSDYDNPDIVKITLYIDKSRSVDLYIDKVKPFTAYIDKEFSLMASIDRTTSKVGYIDKIVSKTLVRER
tara:strand:+ start:1118 stop:2107 length:990 start_codon:yes stop_codon:yes gene_type:complete